MLLLHVCLSDKVSIYVYFDLHSGMCDYYRKFYKDDGNGSVFLVAEASAAWNLG